MVDLDKSFPLFRSSWTTSSPFTDSALHLGPQTKVSNGRIIDAMSNVVFTLVLCVNDVQGC